MGLDRRQLLIAGGVTLATTLTNPLSGAAADDKAAAFIKDHVATIRPLEVQRGIAWWNANITGKDEDLKKKEEAQNKMDEALADKGMFDRIGSLKTAADKGGLKDPLVTRQIKL